jgi:hypothetical protein
MELCETAGFRPKIVQEAPEWLTVLRQLALGSASRLHPGVSQRSKFREQSAAN